MLLVKKYIFLYILFCSVLYGTTYQQFRYFELGGPNSGGAADAVSYVNMMHGDYSDLLTKYRAITPYLASKTKILLGNVVNESKELEKLSFYIVNFLFISVTSLLLYAILEQLGFSALLSIVGVLLFSSSRTVIYSTATPLADAIFILSIAVVVFLMLKKKMYLLAILNPVLILAKEPTFIYMLLPLIHDKVFRSRLYILSLFASILFFFIFRNTIDACMPTQIHSDSASNLVLMIQTHLSYIFETLKTFTTLSGLYDFQHGFALLLPFAVLGYVQNNKNKILEIPTSINLLFYIALFLTIISTNLGRKFFSAYIPVIIYSLLYIDYIIVKFQGKYNDKA